METDSGSADPPRRRRLGGLRARIQRTNPHLLLAGLLASVVVLDLIVSTLYPYLGYVLVTEPDWRAAYETCAAAHEHCVPPMPRSMVWDGILAEYRLDLWGTFIGLYLFRLPVGWALHGPFWFPWQPFVWLVAAGSGVAVQRGARRLSPWTRLPYAAALALWLSGFGAYHWSTLGD